MKYIDKEYIKNEINLAEHFLKEYNKDDKIVCVGGGDALYWYHNFFVEHGVEIKYILDKNASEKCGEEFGTPVVNSDYLLELNDVSNYKFVVTAPKYRDEIIQEICLTFGNVTIYSFEAEIYYTFIKNVQEYRNFLYDNWERFEELSACLADEKSKETIVAFLKGRVSANQKYFIDVMESDQYFPKDIIKLSPNEIIVEVGSNDGKTLEDILSRTNREYQKIYCFEPDEECTPLLEEIIKKEQGDIQLVKKGVGEHVEKLRFKSNSQRGASHVVDSEEYDYAISITTLDDEIKEKVTYIKMDIEGMELKALKGAEKLIRQYHPRLALCVYHEKEDILDIFEYLKDLELGYKFYLRHHNWGATETVLYAI